MADEKQNSVNALKEAADRVKNEDYEDKLGVKDGAVDILTVAVSALVGFGWMMLMLLIISFVSLSYIHFDIKTMLIVSVLTGVIVGLSRCFKVFQKYFKR